MSQKEKNNKKKCLSVTIILVASLYLGAIDLVFY